MTIQKARKTRATRSEKQVASDLGGRLTPASGAREEKADVVVKRKAFFENGILRETDNFAFRVEVKTTEAASYSFSGEDWMKVVQAALKKDEVPVFVITVNLRTMRQMFAVITNRFFSEIHKPGGAPPDIKSVGRRSVKVSKDLLTSEIRGISYHRLVFDTRVPTSRNDVCLIKYADFLQLVERAENEKCD
jgi:hypothetical protein